LYCHQDNLNTDGIYPGKYTYVDQLTSEEMAKVAMENYDPSFTKIVAKVYFYLVYSLLIFLKKIHY